WMLVQLGEGKLADGTPLIRPDTARQLTTIVTPIPIGQASPESAPVRQSSNGAGLGFGLRDYRGHKLVTHTGGLPGYVSKVAMLPDRQLGIAILTNQESPAAFEALARTIMDAYLGAEKVDWVAAWQAVERRARDANRAAAESASSARASVPRPSRPLERDAGSYEDPCYGGMTIARAGAGLTIKFDKTPALSGTLE